MLWHWLIGHEKKISTTYISRSSSFVLYPEDFLQSSDLAYILKMLHVIPPYFLIMNQYGPVWPQKNVGQCDIYFTIQ